MGSQSTGDRPFLVAPYYVNGNLSVYLHKNQDADKLTLLYQAAQGLNYLHSFTPSSIVHLDVKAENILINDEREASICDFGVARVLDNVSTGWTTSNPGYTIRFASPEVLVGEKGGTPSDVYSFARLILHVLSGKLPFYNEKKGTAGVTMKVIRGEPLSREDYSFPLPEPAFSMLWGVLSRCWSFEPRDRPGINEVLTLLGEVQRLTKA